MLVITYSGFINSIIVMAWNYRIQVDTYVVVVELTILIIHLKELLN